MSYECYAITELLSIIFCCKTLKELNYENNEQIRDLYFQQDKILRKKKYDDKKKKCNFKNYENEKINDYIFLESERIIQESYDDEKERKKFYANRI